MVGVSFVAVESSPSGLHGNHPASTFPRVLLPDTALFLPGCASHCAPCGSRVLRGDGVRQDTAHKGVDGGVRPIAHRRLIRRLGDLAEQIDDLTGPPDE